MPRAATAADNAAKHAAHSRMPDPPHATSAHRLREPDAMNNPVRTASIATAATRDVAGWVPPAARVGYAAKGMVYLLIGWIAAKAALASGQAEGATGALAALRDEAGGRLMLLVIGLGLACHVLWRAVQVLLDPEHPGERADHKRMAMRAFYALSGAVYASLAFTAFQLSRDAGASGGNGQEVWIARLLEKPFGTWLVMCAGLGVIGYGLQQLYKAWQGDVNRRMAARDARTHRGLRALGRLGTAARGLVLLPVGWFVFNAGRLYRAEAAADTGEVLEMLGQGWLLLAVGLGLAAYGAHQIGKALYRRIERPA